MNHINLNIVPRLVLWASLVGGMSGGGVSLTGCSVQGKESRRDGNHNWEVSLGGKPASPTDGTSGSVVPPGTEQVPEGGATSGGGDSLRFHFVDGKSMAANWLESYGESAASEENSEVSQWILKNKNALADDIRMSQHSWTEKAEQDTCARTEFKAQANVILDMQRCHRVYSPGDAARILIHESSHHLGVKDESFADAVATNVFEAFKNRKLASVSLCLDQENIVASRILGKWEIDEQMWRKMSGSPSNSQMEIEYAEDHSVLQLFPNVGKCAYQAGWMKWVGEFEKDGERKVLDFRTPFIVVEWRGNPAVLFDEDDPRGGDPMVITDLHRGYRMIARAKDPKDDILFHGGDNNNQPLFPFKRK